MGDGLRGTSIEREGRGREGVGEVEVDGEGGDGEEKRSMRNY